MTDDFERLRLELARRRERGEDFDTAWERAIEELPDTRERRESLAVLQATREHWREGFEWPATAKLAA